MTNKLIIASVVTKNCLKEFLLTKYSCELFNKCNWYVSCDSQSAKELQKFENVKILQFDLEDGASDHNSTDKESRARFLKIILNKFTALETALQENDYCLFLDSDMLFVNQINQNIADFFKTGVDYIVSPHYSRDPINEDKHGFYNVGMFALQNADHMKQWRYLTENCEKFNLYYEQKPFELILSNFNTLNLPINYNIGWWRFNNPRTQNRINQLALVDDKIMFGNLPAVNFHFHTFKAPGGFNPGQFLVDKVMGLLDDSKCEKHQQILEYYGFLSETTF